jgi:hypothetical protein
MPTRHSCRSWIFKPPTRGRYFHEDSKPWEVTQADTLTTWLSTLADRDTSGVDASPAAKV